MKIELREIAIRDLVKDFKDDSVTEEGITGYGGFLDIRPKYQREFVYKDKQRESVIETVLKGFPLNVMYWVQKEEQGYFEVLDGQQRTLSICQYISGEYSVNDLEGNPRSFYNLSDEQKALILNYKLMIYFCTGTDTEKLGWFRTINIAGEKLTPQELRNAVYTGTWLSEAKKHFSKSNCVAANIGDKYLKGSPIRQDYFEKVLKWISNNSIESYMAIHQNDKDCSELWQYFQNVLNWVNILFPVYRKDMKGVDWGYLYNKHKGDSFNSVELEAKYKELLADDEIEGKDTKGFYSYLITGEIKHLSLRSFNDKQKLKAFEKQKGKCPKCTNTFEISQMEGDHIIPWSKGGKTVQTNLQMLCKKCNGIKSNK